MKLWIALLLFVVAFYLMEEGYVFLAVLAAIAIVLVSFSSPKPAHMPVAYPYPEEEEEEAIVFKQKPPKFPETLRVRVRPKAKRRSSWEKSMAGVGDVLDTVLASGYRFATGGHAEAETDEWIAGRGR